MTKQLTKKQFKTFLLIYAAHVDYAYDESEKDFILNQTDIETYNAMYQLFLNKSDYQCLKLILHYKKQYYNSTSKKEEIYSCIIQLLEADGEYSRAEKVFLEFLKRMIEEKV